MSHPKRRVYQHIMEDKSLSILRAKFPDEWVVREYKPDYGIDIVIELFKYIDETKEKADTLGEFVFGQIKSTKKTKIRKLILYPRKNVEKWSHLPQKEESLEVEVISFKLETDELLTVQSMGAGVPVILFLVCLDLNRVFFVCLNDLIDKVILPEDETYSMKASKTIYIPVKNELTQNKSTMTPVSFYAKRSKLYAGFTKFIYQQNEIKYLCGYIRDTSISNISQSKEIKIIMHFLRILLRYDFWENTKMWLVIEDCHNQIKSLCTLIDKIINEENFVEEYFPNLEKYIVDWGFDKDEYVMYLLTNRIIFTWNQLVNLSNLYEEICREWFLPTFFAQYPFD